MKKNNIYKIFAHYGFNYDIQVIEAVTKKAAKEKYLSDSWNKEKTIDKVLKLN